MPVRQIITSHVEHLGRLMGVRESQDCTARVAYMVAAVHAVDQDKAMEKPCQRSLHATNIGYKLLGGTTTELPSIEIGFFFRSLGRSAEKLDFLTEETTSSNEMPEETTSE